MVIKDEPTRKDPRKDPRRPQELVAWDRACSCGGGTMLAWRLQRHKDRTAVSYVCDNCDNRESIIHK